MALTLLIEGRRLPRTDASCLTRRAGTARAEPGFHMGDALRDALMETACVLRGITRPSGTPADAQPRRRLIFRDSLQQLEVKGHIRPIQAQAGREISRVHAATVGGGPKLAQSRYGEVDGGAPGEDIPASLLPACANRFQPWRSWAETRRASRRGSATLFDVTLRVCAENLGIRQAADALGMDERTVLGALQRSLWQYCLIAGWETEAA
ncbi:MAG TPA: hypothetical protein VNZ61_08810 [Roseomonas sp.]|nr:hypothetical protein [Roseomonas sp.]